MWNEFMAGFNRGINKPDNVSAWTHIKNEFWKGYWKGFDRGFIWGFGKKAQLERDMEAFRQTFGETMKNWRPRG